MKLAILFSILISSLSSLASHQYQIPANKLDSIPADPKDIGSIDGIIAALYEVVSGAAGQARNWDRMRTLFYQKQN